MPTLADTPHPDMYRPLDAGQILRLPWTELALCCPLVVIAIPAPASELPDLGSPLPRTDGHHLQDVDCSPAHPWPGVSAIPQSMMILILAGKCPVFIYWLLPKRAALFLVKALLSTM